MKKITRIGWHFVFGIILVLFLAFHITGRVSAAPMSLDMEVTVDQTSARDVLNYVNDFRTGGDGWYWNSDDSTKTQTGVLPAYTYDYALEEIALKRAYEVAVSFDHTRPNGTSCFTLKASDGTSSWGENIAAGSSTAEGAFNQWREENRTYSGQGHRRAMLSKRYTAIGIAHVVYNGTHYWVQEFGETPSSMGNPGDLDGTKVVSVEIETSFMDFVIVPDKTYFNGTYGGSEELPVVRGYYQKEGETWGSNGVPVSDGAVTGITWSSSDPSVATITNNSVCNFVGAGSTTLTCTGQYEGQTYSASLSVNVGQKYIYNSDVLVSVPEDVFSFNGCTPEPTITYNGMTLAQGVDYTVTYQYNNRVTNYAYCKITGIGNYYGNRTEYFKISARDIAECTFEDLPDVIYNGATQTPSEIVGTFEGNTLTKGTHYTMSVSNNVNQGTATVTLSGVGNFTGTKELYFTIIPMDAENLSISPIAAQNYTGSPLTPALSIRNGSKALVKDTDYTAVYSNNINLGTADVALSFIGNYTGTKTIHFEIIGKAVSNLTYTGLVSPLECTGEPIYQSDLKFFDGDTELKENVDYTLSYTNNTNVGTAGITMTGKNNYAGTRSLSFRIKARSVSNWSYTALPAQTYTGEELKPTCTITDKGLNKTLVEGVDYSLSYADNINAGRGKAIYTGLGIYQGSTLYQYFYIYQASVSSLTISALSDQVYTGSAITPAPVVKLGTKTLTKDADYTLSYSNNTYPGQASVVVEGTGNFTGSKTIYFTINKKAVSALSIAAIPGQTYTGTAITPALTIKNGKVSLKKDTDYTVSYSNNVNVGTATVTVTGKGYYEGTRKLTFNIAASSIEDAVVSDIPTQYYTGSAICPSVTVKENGKTLVYNTDYTLIYENNIAVGTASVTINGIGNYAKTITKEFTIAAYPMEKITVSSIGNQTYTGSKICPSAILKNGNVTLIEGTDYTVNYGENVYAGPASVVFLGKGNYSGTKIVNFTINPKTVYGMDISAIADQTYNGKAFTPGFTVKDGNITLQSGTDYDVQYSSNTNVGTAVITVTGKGNYTGSKKTNFTILPADLSKATLSAIGDCEYTGNAIIPDATLSVKGKTLVKETDYTVSAKNNTEIGTATITFTGCGNYKGSKTGSFKIVAKTLTEDMICEIPIQFYSGKTVIPDITVKNGDTILSIDTDYQAEFKDNDKPGTGTVIITGTGHYKGSVQETFEICKYTGWQLIGNDWYYFDSNGQYQTGWVKVDNAWYYMSSTGVMQKGWLKYNDNWYYLASAMQTGWVKVNNAWYYMNSSGVMQKGWLKYNNNWYYLASAMQTGWVKINNKWYYMNTSGIMQTGWVNVGNKWYYLNASGEMQTGWLKLGTTWYYLDSDGSMVTGSKKIGSKTYKFASNGACKNP